MLRIVLLFAFYIITVSSYGQRDTIYLENPSFEDTPRRGGYDLFGYPTEPPLGWFDCGRAEFPRETPPDIHPVDFWEVEKSAYEGNTYLGMVVRDVDSWESVSQRFKKPLQADNCYSFSIYLSRSSKYVSLSQELNQIDNYTTPAVLRIWGGSGICNRKELLAESGPLTNFKWIEYSFDFMPKRDYNYITLEAFYKTPTLFAYNGHILLDNASAIIQKTCPGLEEILDEIEDEPVVEKEIPDANQKPSPAKKVEEKAEEIVEVKKEIKEEPEKRPPSRLMTDLDRKKLRKGQTIRIEQLYFKADTSSIDPKSFPVLTEIFNFLNDNRDIIVEISGHTNGLPEHDYCDKLSTDRAKVVAEFLMLKGISPKRLQYKGYGKRKPIASNRTKVGRQKNQRVEIKILSLDS